MQSNHNQPVMALARSNIPNGHLHWLDNLRSAMIFLVVLAHGAIIYEKYSMGKDWWLVVDPADSDAPGILFLILNIFVIATVFFISGYLTPPSVASKNAWTFIKAKFKRLMIPWLIATLALLPLYKAVFLYSRHLPQEPWTTYFHWNNTWSQGWLWFLPVLFFFDLIYLGLRRLKIAPTRLSMKRGILLAMGAGITYAFGMDILGLHGWTKSVLIDFQNERLLLYFIVYLTGALSYRHQVFRGEWSHKKQDIVLHSVGWIPVNLYLFMLIYSLIKPGDPLVSRTFDTVVLRSSFVLALAYLVYALLVTFKRYLDRQGRLSNEINANSYYVYILHVVILGVLAALMLESGLPSFLKLSLAVLGTYLISNVLVSGFRRAFRLKN